MKWRPSKSIALSVIGSAVRSGDRNDERACRASQVAESQRLKGGSQEQRYKQTVNKSLWISVGLSTKGARFFTNGGYGLWAMGYGLLARFARTFDAKCRRAHIPYPIAHSPI